MENKNIGKYVIVRGDRSGVFAGVLEAQEGREVELTDCRRLWYWDGANSVSDIALIGTSKPNECKFCAPVASIMLTDAIEIIPATDRAEKVLRGVKPWTRS